MEFLAPSGAKVVIGLAPFQDAIALKNAMAKELALTGMDLKVEGLKDFDVAVLLPALLAMDSSPVVYAAMFKCLARCSYNGDKITETTFEPAEARGDYYDIIIACAKENLSPFFKGLASKLKPFMARPEKQPEAQK